MTKRKTKKKTWKEFVNQDIAAAYRAAWKTVIKRLTFSWKGQEDAERKSKIVSGVLADYLQAQP